jgi:hypothetical protein
MATSTPFVCPLEKLFQDADKLARETVKEREAREKKEMDEYISRLYKKPSFSFGASAGAHNSLVSVQIKEPKKAPVCRAFTSGTTLAQINEQYPGAVVMLGVFRVTTSIADTLAEIELAKKPKKAKKGEGKKCAKAAKSAKEMIMGWNKKAPRPTKNTPNASQHYGF